MNDEGGEENENYGLLNGGQDEYHKQFEHLAHEDYNDDYQEEDRLFNVEVFENVYLEYDPDCKKKYEEPNYVRTVNHGPRLVKQLIDFVHDDKIIATYEVECVEYLVEGKLVVHASLSISHFIDKNLENLNHKGYQITKVHLNLELNDEVVPKTVLADFEFSPTHNSIVKCYADTSYYALYIDSSCVGESENFEDLTLGL